MRPPAPPKDKTPERFVPSVSGLDLEQALNYVSSGKIPLRWFYESFTNTRILYSPGSRPGLEAFLERHAITGKPTSKKLEHLVRSVYESITHYSILGIRGPTARGLTEEALLLLGEGWCNEQARVLCALAQIAGFPARLVFAGMRDKRGHVLTEVFHAKKWVLIDQTCAFVFQDDEGSYFNVFDLKFHTAKRRTVLRRYADALAADKRKAADALVWDRIVPYGTGDPMRLFHSVGYCNYFIRNCSG